MPQLLSARCPFCASPGSDRACAVCRKEVYLDGISAFASYGNPVVRKALSVWKYDRDRSAEPIIRSWIARGAARMAPPLLPFYACPVSLHVRRCRVRGFDQATVFATWIGEIYGIPVEEYLVRTKMTTQQAQKGSGRRRVGELDGIFSLRPDAVVPEHVLLCDDVFTSGATMDAAARALKEAGAKTVWGCVIARG